MVSIEKLQSEIPHDPHEAGEVLSVLFGVNVTIYAARFDLNVFREVYYERKLLKRVFIDTAHTVVYEKRSQ